MFNRGRSVACMCLISAAIVAAAGCADKDNHNEGTHAQQSKINNETSETAGKSEDEIKAEIENEKNLGKLMKLSDVENAYVRTVDVPFERTQFTPSLAPYAINRDLSNIANLDQFTQMSTAQREMLAKNGFFVSPTMEEQLFYIYEHNEYKKIPTFVTEDSYVCNYGFSASGVPCVL